MPDGFILYLFVSVYEDVLSSKKGAFEEGSLRRKELNFVLQKAGRKKSVVGLSVIP